MGDPDDAGARNEGQREDSTSAPGGWLDQPVAVAMQNNQVPKIIATATHRNSALMAMHFYRVFIDFINLHYLSCGKRNPWSPCRSPATESNRSALVGNFH
jgi:hypothetical protein